MSRTRAGRPATTMKRMSVKTRRPLPNPFILVGQGFLAGAILFFAFTDRAVEVASASAAPEIEAAATIAD